MKPVPNIICEYTIGNTRVKIADNYYADKTADDVKRILRDVAKKAQRSLSAKANRNNIDRTEVST